MSVEAFGARIKQEAPAQNQEKLEEKAKVFWEARLENEVRISAPQDPHCAFAVVVPVYNEKPERILKQIESLRNQRDIDASALEIIYVVSNDVSDGTEKSKEATAANQAVLEMLKNTQGLNVFAIDKSSPGKEIKGSNVGKTRNRGIAEATARFHENGKNGILIQSDADAYFEDPDYLRKVGDILNQNPDALGIAGGFVYEFDPDTSDPEQIELLKVKLDKFILLREWEAMVDFLEDPASQAFFQDDRFVGVNMISRSFETAVVGGLDDLSAGENDNFAKNLNTLAGSRGPGVLGMKKELLVITALRESDRTGASLKKDFDQIDLEKPLVGTNPLALQSEAPQKMLKKIEANLHNPDGIRKALSDGDGNLLCGEDVLQELVAHLATRQTLDLADPFFVAMHDKLYPKIPITSEGLEELESKVLQHPDGRKFIDNMRARLTNIRVKRD